MGKYFGTDGFRGKAGVDLTAEHAFQVGRFLGWYYSQKHTEDSARIVIGKDTRRSSYMFENALAAGITSSGADAYLLHVTTTPCVSYITRTENFDCGVMISASHNPFYDNGIKLMNGVGEKMDDALQAEWKHSSTVIPLTSPGPLRERWARPSISTPAATAISATSPACPPGPLKSTRLVWTAPTAAPG